MITKNFPQGLLLQQRSYVEDGYGTHDGGTQLTEQATPFDAQQIENPAAQGTTEETQQQIHKEAKAAAFHQLTGTETGQTSNNNR